MTNIFLGENYLLIYSWGSGESGGGFITLIAVKIRLQTEASAVQHGDKSTVGNIQVGEGSGDIVYRLIFVMVRSWPSMHADCGPFI